MNGSYDSACRIRENGLDGDPTGRQRVFFFAVSRGIYPPRSFSEFLAFFPVSESGSEVRDRDECEADISGRSRGDGAVTLLICGDESSETSDEEIQNLETRNQK